MLNCVEPLTWGIASSTVLVWYALCLTALFRSSGSRHRYIDLSNLGVTTTELTHGVNSRLVVDSWNSLIVMKKFVKSRWLPTVKFNVVDLADLGPIATLTTLRTWQAGMLQWNEYLFSLFSLLYTCSEAVWNKPVFGQILDPSSDTM